ncbi:MAG: class I SAM-dependent methyltransferase [Lacibacter sp.]
MDQYKETFDTWNKIASLYEEKFMKLDLYNESYDLFCKLLHKENASIFEIGCGPGNIAQYLLSKHPGFDLFGIDVATNMIELAQKNNPSAKFSVMDCRKIDSIQSTFDGIICGFCLPYLSGEEAVKLVKDAYQLLNTDGVIYLSFVDGTTDQSGYKTGSGGNRVYFYYHQTGKLEKILTEQGFTHIQFLKVKYSNTGTVDDIHTILIARKMNV